MASLQADLERHALRNHAHADPPRLHASYPAALRTVEWGLHTICCEDHRQSAPSERHATVTHAAHCSTRQQQVQASISAARYPWADKDRGATHCPRLWPVCFSLGRPTDSCNQCHRRRKHGSALNNNTQQVACIICSQAMPQKVSGGDTWHHSMISFPLSKSLSIIPGKTQQQI